MLKNIRILAVTALISLVALPTIALSETSERLEFSGFGRVVGGYLDEESATYEGYSDSFSFTQQSLFALQSDLTITDTLSLSVQLLAHSSEARESGVEWLYLNYEPNQNWRFKIGKLRTPFFRYSDVIDVGFAYPWIMPPQQVYSGFLFSNYEGVTGIFRFNIDQINFEIEAYSGVYDGDFKRANEKINVDIDEINGIIFRLQSGNLSARVSATQSSDIFADVPEFEQLANAIENAGFIQNAETLRFNGKATVYQANINYDTLDYFVAAEFVKISSDLIVIPAIDSYYVSAGYNFNQFQTHLTYSVSESSYDKAENFIPKGVNPGLTQLSFAYDQVTGNLPRYSLDSITVGIRWDFRHDMAAKAEVTFLEGKPDENSFFAEINDPNFNRKATLYQVALELVF